MLSWGKTHCPQFSFFQTILGQRHPLNQSKLGLAPAARLGTGFASLLKGAGILVPSWQEGAIRAKDSMGCLGSSVSWYHSDRLTVYPAETLGGTWHQMTFKVFGSLTPNLVFLDRADIHKRVP